MGMKTMMTIILVFVGMLMMAIVNLVIMVIGLASCIGTQSTDLVAERLQRGQKAKTLRLCGGDVAFCQQIHF